MGQHGARRTNAADPAQRPFEMAVRRVRRQADAVDDPGRDAGERLESRVVELDDIGRIAEIADTETGRERREAVILLKRPNRHAGGFERAVDDVGPQRRPVKPCILLESILKSLGDQRQHRCRGPDRDRLPHPLVDRPQIVDAVDVIGMGMGVEQGVDPLHAGA